MNTGSERFLGPRMVVLAFILFNLAIGLTYGAFGALVLPMEERFQTTRPLVSLCISLVILAGGLLAPVIGRLIGRYPIRHLMMAGALLASAGYACLAFATNATQMLLCFGLLIGPGMSFLGPIPCFTLVSNWYRDGGQGRALGVVNMPVLVMLLPLLVVAALPEIGFRAVALLLALGYAVAVPLILLVVDRPAAPTDPEAAAPTDMSPGDTPVLGIATLMKSPAFLLLIVGTGLIVGAGVGKTAHMMPLLAEAGWSTESAALLLSISGGTGIVGALLFGWLADRGNAGVALMANALLQALVWVILILPVSFPLLVLDAVLIGACGGGFISAKGVLVSRIYGSANFAAIMGYTSMATLPFLFGLPPLAGLMRLWTGNYTLAVQVYIAGFLIAGLCFAVLARVEKRAVAED